MPKGHRSNLTIAVLRTGDCAEAVYPGGMAAGEFGLSASGRRQNQFSSDLAASGVVVRSEAQGFFKGSAGG